MTKLLTVNHSHPGARRRRQSLVASAVLLIAIVTPAAGCEKSLGRWIAGAPIEERGVATFTGEFVNGVPVYRLPPITVVTRRPTGLAKAQRNDSQTHAARSRTSSTPAPSAGKAASGSREANAIKPCIAKRA